MPYDNAKRDIIEKYDQLRSFLIFSAVMISLTAAAVLIRHLMYTQKLNYYNITEDYDKQAFHYSCNSMSGKDAEKIIDETRTNSFKRYQGYVDTTGCKTITASGKDGQQLYDITFAGDGIVVIKLWNVADEYRYKVTD